MWWDKESFGFSLMEASMSSWNNIQYIYYQRNCYLTKQKKRAQNINNKWWELLILFLLSIESCRELWISDRELWFAWLAQLNESSISFLSTLVFSFSFEVFICILQKVCTSSYVYLFEKFIEKLNNYVT